MLISIHVLVIGVMQMVVARIILELHPVAIGHPIWGYHQILGDFNMLILVIIIQELVCGRIVYPIASENTLKHP
ncbi:hypothetical protein ACFL6I_28445 [candidate division KSB1 bacterium]